MPPVVSALGRDQTISAYSLQREGVWDLIRVPELPPGIQWEVARSCASFESAFEACFAHGVHSGHWVGMRKPLRGDLTWEGERHVS
jgi:hypothetical protein